MVEPILLYGSEIWGYENIKIIEQVHLGFCKRILKVRSFTPNFMVYEELRRYPLEIRVKIRMISFWNRLVNNNERMSSCIYRLLYSLNSNGIQSFKWLNCIESIFNDVGLSYIFENQISFIDVTCTFCNDIVGNEFHVFFMCNNDRIVNLRNIYLPKYYAQYPNITKMSGLLSLCIVQLYKRFTIFIKKVTALL